LDKAALDLDGQEDFVELAQERALEAQEVVAGDLHGQGAAAGDLLAGHRQLGHGARETGEIDAVVFEEAVVFRCEQGVDELPRDLLEAQRVALLLAELADQFPVTRVHAHRRLQLHVAQGRDVRQIGGQVQVGAGQQPDGAECAENGEAEKPAQDCQNTSGNARGTAANAAVEIGKRLFIRCW
jgi:uncharacterized protein YjbJ (UPF0337 family)